MAYNEHLAERMRRIFADKKVPYNEKNMMGGLCFMVDDKMCAGIVKDELMARIHPDLYEAALQKKGCKEINFTGRPMKGYVFVDADGTDMDKDLEYWLQLCIDFNPLAKSSKKK